MAALTPREREVARLVAEAKANKIIAHEMGLKLSTAQWYVKSILEKTGLPNRAGIAVWVVRGGLT